MRTLFFFANFLVCLVDVGQVGLALLALCVIFFHVCLQILEKAAYFVLALQDGVERHRGAQGCRGGQCRHAGVIRATIAIAVVIEHRGARAIRYGGRR